MSRGYLSKLCAAIAVIGGCLGSASALAYNDSVTHPALSREASRLSNLYTDPMLLPRMGLPPGDIQTFSYRPRAGNGGSYTIAELIGEGAYDEDIGTRALNHFFDPKNNRPLTLARVPLGTASPTWILEDSGPISAQDRSLADARDYLFKAFTYNGASSAQASETARGQASGEMFLSLGAAVHHMQDMAQPQHVRNDMHCDKWYCWFVFLYNPSLYESYTAKTAPDDNIAANVEALAQSASPVFPASNDFKLARDFWQKNANTGIAAFTNSNFVSQGTNFAIYRGQVSTPKYSSPAPGNPMDYTVADLFAGSNKPVPTDIKNLCGDPAVNCAMTMYPTAVSAKASTLSIFDQDLVATGLSVTYNEYDFTPSYVTDRLFALNRFNFDDAHTTLIPMAVGYSAGIINYFFRGNMEISLPDEGVYAIVDHSQVQVTDPAAGFAGFDKIKLKLANTTPGGEAMSGGTLQAILKFRRNLLFTDDLSKMPDQVDAFSARSTVEEIVLSDVKSGVSLGSQGTAPQPFTFTFAQALPLNATDVSLQVVYRGVLGEEQDAVAVTTKNISEPTYYTYHNFSDYISVGGQPYTRDEVNANQALLDMILPRNCIDTTTGKLLSSCFQPFTISMDLNFGAGGAYRLATMNGLNVRQFLRLAWLGDADANTLLSNTGPCMPQDDSVKPANWQLSYNASGVGTLNSPLFKTMRGVWGWYQTSCVWSGDNVPSADNWADRLVPLNPVPAPTTLQMNFQ